MASRRKDDDSEEDEATALDLRPSSRSARPEPSQPRSKPPAAAAATAAARRKTFADDDSEDEEATEFLQARPASRGATEPVLRAKGRAVPIEAAAAEPAAPSSPAPSPAPAPAAIVAPASLSALPSMGALDSPAGPRPLPQRTTEATATTSSGVASPPRVTRIQMMERLANRQASTTNDHSVDDDEHQRISDSDPDDGETTLPPGKMVMAPAPPHAVVSAPTTAPQSPKPRVATRVDAAADETQAADDPEETQAPGADSTNQAADSTGDAEPAPRRVPNTAEGEPLPAKPRAPRPSFEPEKPHDGVLVVDAPAEATVTVNGVERGKGTIKVAALDRDARHAVRIHCPGFAPWSGSVTLQGKQAAKIRPQLKPRAR